MSKSEDRLLSLLFQEGRELKNLKFFPGPECASADDLYNAAGAAISAALQIDDGDMIPVGNGKSISIADFAANL